MKRVSASSPSKVILFGEHAVVYGKGAVVAAIDRRTRVEAMPSYDILIRAPLKPRSARLCWKGGKLSGKKEAKEYLYVKCALEKVFAEYGSACGMRLNIKSEAPVGAGLGSSASAVVATIAASSTFLDMRLSSEEIKKMAHETEREVQGASSGIDPTIATYGGMLFYKDGKFEKMPARNLPLTIGFTKEKGSTKELVANVRRLAHAFPQMTNLLFETADLIAEEARKNISGKPDLKCLGRLMNMNQGILESLGVSTEKLEALINATRRAGAYGAKLTGAGGGGCMIALGRNLEDAIKKAGGVPIKARITEEGVKVNKPKRIDL